MRAILTYHSIDDSRSVISTRAAELEAHLAWIVGSGARVVDLSELLASPPDDDIVALTFDDAFENFATVAWPLLRRRGFPATLFVPTGHAGGFNDWPELPGVRVPKHRLLGWRELSDLARDGVRLGAHSVTHPDLRKLSDADLEHELKHSAAEIGSLTGAPVADFAYPYGALDQRVVEAARAVFQHAFTTEMRPLRAGEDPARIPRIDAFYLSAAQHIGSWGSRSLRSYLTLRSVARKFRGR